MIRGMPKLRNFTQCFVNKRKKYLSTEYLGYFIELNYKF